MDIQASSGAGERVSTPPARTAGVASAAPAGEVRETSGATPDGARAPAPGPGRRSTGRRRRFAVVGVGLVLLALVAALLRPSPLDVDAGRVVRGPLEVSVDAEGVTRVRELYQVAAPVGGRLSRISVREGDRIEAGTVVARIAPSPLDPRSLAQARARLDGARAALREARTRLAQNGAVLEQAERSAQRVRVLEAAGAVSREARERAELEQVNAEQGLRAAESRADEAEAEVEAARAGLLDSNPARARSTGQAVAIIRAPVSGRVLRIQEPSERVVPPGTPLLELADAGRLQIMADVLSTDAVAVRAGARVRILDWGGSGEVEGRVRLVEPSGFTKVSALGVEEQRVNVVADLAPVPAGLGDGYQVDVRIVTWSAPAVTKVPVAALVRRGPGWEVFVLENGRAHLRPVTIGHRGTDEAEVLDGLREGEAVVLFPPDRLQEGARVRTR